MADVINEFIQFVAAILDGFAAVVIGYGAISAFYRIVFQRVPMEMQHRLHALARIDLGRKLVIGLEFLLGADILRTAVAPTFTRLAIVASIIVIRTALNFFLEKDIERMERQEHLVEE